MADEQDRWLDRETAELLLRGESPEAVDPAVRDRAERLAATLAALSAPTPPASGELPGEAAALAAFRKARAEAAGAPDAVSGALGRGAPRRSLDAGLVRIGGRDNDARRSRRAGPLKLGLAAALAAGMVGGAGIAAATGVLPTPFTDRETPDPAASVSAAATSERPLVPPSPTPRTTVPRDDTEADAGKSGAPGAPGEKDRTPACRDIRAGKEAGALREHARKKAAGGDCGNTKTKDKGKNEDKGKNRGNREKGEERGKGGESRQGGDKRREQRGRDVPDAGERGDGHRPTSPHDPSHQRKDPSGKKSSGRE